MVALCLGAAACSRRAASPEDQIRAFLERAESAVREKDVAALGALITDDYRDAENRARRDVLDLARLHFLRAGSLHLATRLDDFEFRSDGTINAEVYAALGRARIDLASLPDLDAELYRFDLVLRRGGDGLQAARAAWRAATIEDLG
jgi:hypothetical protein